MKRKVGDEARVNMPLFFGFVGLFNTIFLIPGFPVLHYTGVEPFKLPPTRRIWTIVLVRNRFYFRNRLLTSKQVNSAASLVSDFCWAYAMLLTSPLVVTVSDCQLSITSVPLNYRTVPVKLVIRVLIQDINRMS